MGHCCLEIILPRFGQLNISLLPDIIVVYVEFDTEAFDNVPSTDKT